MALFKPFMGSRAALDAQEKHAGYAYFCTDDGSFHIDYVDADGVLQRKQLNAKEAEILAGYDIVTALNSSDATIPTSNAVLNAIDDKITALDLDNTYQTKGNYATVYMSAEEPPADAAVGALWINTSNNIIYGEEVKF